MSVFCKKTSHQKKIQIVSFKKGNKGNKKFRSHQTPEFLLLQY